MALEESDVRQALATLRHRGLASMLSGAGHRVEKYGHRLGESLNLGRRELAILCVLMLRGAQTVGELRGRTDRMHEFSDMEEVEHVLNTLVEHEPALVAPAARGRWGHLWHEPTEVPITVSASPSLQELRIENLEREVAQLKQKIEQLLRQFE